MTNMNDAGTPRANKPAIALKRRNDAIKKYVFKLKKLEELLETNAIESIPKNMRPATFVAWIDETLGIERFSRNALYETDVEYTALHEKMEHLLERLAKKRQSKSKKESEISNLREQLKTAERRIQSYVDAYTAARAELQEKDKEIARLLLQLNRMKDYDQKVTPLRSVRRSHDDSDRH